ncbi:hypothetical protein CAPTEDRAFT_154277 [Capitella teleta]|uniref:Protein MEMO1 n=1 Tax=Capitella teleta TaxID=283909 RepID=R7TZA1_CAPTE|nr:hypothetical protein CAPTEDRAFT_154277 [Capitella teleta]|eukprot:ELT96731.1 hypothetical protein CAPTEDRAFT_154277 [Capitella teleta]
MSRVRKASHAGSWYTGDGEGLNKELGKWLSKAPAGGEHARAIIAPHAGYSYCGACSAHAYKQIDPSRVHRVFILGPSHHVRLNGCAITAAEKYQTPLYDLTIDAQISEELYSTSMFEKMSNQTDEDEHSIEMHLPYVAKVMQSRQGHFTVIPVLVGSLNPDKEAAYGRIFSRYLADPNNLFVISSDFCHWGQRFRYTYYDKSKGDIYKSIEHLDRMGMNLIEEMDPPAFTAYLEQYGNTICGRHPIGVLLNSIKCLRESRGNGHRYSLHFLKYAQSSQCLTNKDSSVSYASAALTIV